MIGIHPYIGVDILPGAVILWLETLDCAVQLCEIRYVLALTLWLSTPSFSADVGPSGTY